MGLKRYPGRDVQTPKGDVFETGRRESKIGVQSPPPPQIPRSMNNRRMRAVNESRLAYPEAGCVIKSVELEPGT